MLEPQERGVHGHPPNSSTDVALIRELGTDKVIGDPANARNRNQGSLSEIYTIQKGGSTETRQPTNSFRYQGA
jgi:hypothetical protein